MEMILDNGAKFIITALPTNSFLTELYLSYNNLGDDGANFISTAFQSNSSLIQLYLSS